MIRGGFEARCVHGSEEKKFRRRVTKWRGGSRM